MYQEQTGNVFFHIAKGVGVALSFSLLAVIVFASVRMGMLVPDKIVGPILQTIKVLSIALGTIVFVRGEKGFLQGIAIGLLFTALSYLTFSSLGGDFSLSIWILAEMALAVVVGGACGALAVNVKRD